MDRVQGNELILEPQGRLLVKVDGATVTITEADGVTPKTLYAAATGGGTVSQPITTENGIVVAPGGGPWWFDPGPIVRHAIHPDGRVLDPVQLDYSSGVDSATLVDHETRLDSAESRVAGFIRNLDEPWYGDWTTAGNAGGSVGFPGTPTAAPATTVGSGGVTLPLTNGTVPITDCAQLDANGGSFTLGGQVIVYLGRSASSGAGNATGCYTDPRPGHEASGTYAAGTALGYVSIGFFEFVVYRNFGLDHPNVPLPGTTQGGGLVTNYWGPTVNDAMEGYSVFVGAKDTGTPYAQHKPITGFEGIAQIEGGNTALDGYTAPLLGTASRTNVVGAAAHVKNVIGHKLSHNASGGPTFGFWDQYDGLYQGATALKQYTTLNGAATLPQATIPVVSGAAMPPASAANPVTVMIGPNADGMGGQQVTYTGISSNDLTGCTGGTGTIATGSRVTNIVRGVNVKDPLASTTGLLLGDTGWSATLITALRGGTDGDLAMFALTGPTNAEVSGGLTLVRLNAGSGQTKSVLKMYDTGGSNRMSLSVAGDWIASGRKFIGQQAGTTTCVLDGSNGSMQLGISTAAGPKLFGVLAGTPTNPSGGIDSDFVFATDGIWQRRAGVMTKITT